MGPYFVTYCTMDQDVGANPLWHTCLVLSEYEAETTSLRVVETWGFYGLPTTIADSWQRSLKKSFKLDVDFYGNHGKLKHEEVRALDLGVGLHGVTFELTREKFVELQNKCRDRAAGENAAIAEAVEKLHLQPKPAKEVRIYEYENKSDQIFQMEVEAAEREGREPRLFPFSFSLFNPSTCKVQALHLLHGILSPEQVERISGFHQAVSRFSGKTEKIYLYSSGPLRTHKRANGEVSYYRVNNDDGVCLRWTNPPQEIETLSDETRNLLQLPVEYADRVKLLCSRLQKLEWFFMTAKLDDKAAELRASLLSIIREHYQAFAVIKPKTPAASSSIFSSWFMWSLSLPANQDEAELMNNMAAAKHLLNCFYHAVIDDWKIDEQGEDLPALAAYLQPEQKKALCAILGRTLVVEEVVDEAQQDSSSVITQDTYVLTK